MSNYIHPSSSKFNPKDSEKTSKRHQLSMTFPCVFRFLSCVFWFLSSEKSSKVDVFSMSFGLNFEDEGVITSALVFGWGLKCPLKIYFNAQCRGEGITYPIKRESDSFFRDKLIPFWTICHTQKLPALATHNSEVDLLLLRKIMFILVLLPTKSN